MRWAGKHAFDRAKERYGVEPTHADFREMVFKILAALSGDADPGAVLVRKNGMREVWDVMMPAGLVRVVYEPESSSIISVLPQPGRCAP